MFLSPDPISSLYVNVLRGIVECVVYERRHCDLDFGGQYHII